MATELQQLIETKHLSPEEIASRTREIYDSVLRQSDYIDGGNFAAIHPNDIEQLFDLYDGQFFDGGCRKLLGDVPLEFRLSKRMTQAGGKAGRRELRDRSGKIVRTEYELAVSTTLLFQTFQEDHRPVVMSGIDCRDALIEMQQAVDEGLDCIERIAGEME
jgi:hypothetical protein